MYAAVLKLVDKHVSEACGAIHGGSTPLCGTNLPKLKNKNYCYNSDTSRRSSQDGHGTGLKNLGCWFESNLRHIARVVQFQPKADPATAGG